MRVRMNADLTSGRPSPGLDATARPVRADDANCLADLMLDSYRGSIDDGGETLDDAKAEVARLLAGEYGAFDFEASEVIERDGRLVSATLVTRYEGTPLIAFSMTASEWKRRGLARGGLLRTMDRLRKASQPQVSLAVTKGNVPAEALYVSLGFVAA
jgi:hypothetical protein